MALPELDSGRLAELTDRIRSVDTPCLQLSTALLALSEASSVAASVAWLHFELPQCRALVERLVAIADEATTMEQPDGIDALTDEEFAQAHPKLAASCFAFDVIWGVWIHERTLMGAEARAAEGEAPLAAIIVRRGVATASARAASRSRSSRLVSSATRLLMTMCRAEAVRTQLLPFAEDLLRAFERSLGPRRRTWDLGSDLAQLDEAALADAGQFALLWSRMMQEAELRAFAAHSSGMPIAGPIGGKVAPAAGRPEGRGLGEVALAFLNAVVMLRLRVGRQRPSSALRGLMQRACLLADSVAVGVLDPRKRANGMRYDMDVFRATAALEEVGETLDPATDFVLADRMAKCAPLLLAAAADAQNDEALGGFLPFGRWDPAASPELPVTASVLLSHLVEIRPPSLMAGEASVLAKCITVGQGCAHMVAAHHQAKGWMRSSPEYQRSTERLLAAVAGSADLVGAIAQAAARGKDGATELLEILGARPSADAPFAYEPSPSGLRAEELFLRTERPAILRQHRCLAGDYCTTPVARRFAQSLCASRPGGNQGAGPALLAVAEGPPQCATCGALGEHGKELRKCGRCRGPLYCSTDCQKADWKRHKLECRRLAEKRAEGTAEASAEGALAPAPQARPEQAAAAAGGAVDGKNRRRCEPSCGCAQCGGGSSASCDGDGDRTQFP